MVAKCNSKAWHSGPGPTEVEEARRPGGLRLSPTVFSPHGIDLHVYGTEYSASIVLSAAGKHRRRTKETKAEYRHGAFGRPGVASRHSSQSGCRIRPCEDAPLRAAAAAAAAKPFTASLQAACLPVLSSVLCRGIAAKLPGSTAARREQERGKRQAKMRKSENGASRLWESECQGRELVLHCKVRSRVRAQVQPCKIARRRCVVALIEGGFVVESTVCSDLP